jgi:predicted glycoside hydrolase/deacetylase ChbG (UPF0249 family)
MKGVAPAERILVVCADDFGRSAGVNAGVAAACERGIVTSASLLVRPHAAAMAAAYARRRPQLAVGLHLDLGEWRYSDGQWQQTDVVAEDTDPGAVEAEVTRQLERFRALLGRNPTHLDSHQHVHHSEPTATIMNRLAAELGVPLRGCGDRIRYCGGFYGQTGRGEPFHEAITIDALVGIIRTLPPGVTELACHPGLGSDHGPYDIERRLEVESLCDPRVRTAVDEAGVALRSFADLAVPPTSHW